ncbi:MAG TPA: 4Fe-4S dicluster domain-containing protein [Rectinemataceae bacterium]|nr:4Fe-4S dicluster domain-containing protein [Rectinemataceae bacterium]
MNTYLLRKVDVRPLLEEAAADWEIYAPLREESGDVNFKALPKADPAASLENLSLDDEPTLLSPKSLFFPQSETMFSFGQGGIRESVEASPKLLFGIASCDLAGILFSDGFFAKDFPDKYYLSRAEGRLIIVKGCLRPPRPGSCFCHSAGTGPFAEAGFDLQLVDLGAYFLVEAGSERGEGFVAAHERFFARSGGSADPIREAEASNAAARSRAVKEAAKGALGPGVAFATALELMRDGDFEKNYARIGERCIYCGACLYVCPTCTCFNVVDRAVDGEGTRMRTWDGCVFEGYTREASGHNPRPTKAARTARRYEHKLKYDPLVAGRSGCVGCGRCLDSCPVGIGMSKFIREVADGSEEM